MPSKTDTAAPRPTVRNTIPTPPPWVPIFGPVLPALLTVPEAAELAGLSERSMRDLIYLRRFDTVRIGRSVRVPTVNLLAYMAQVPANRA
jgi:excisionase family DNA binding protein